MPEVTVRKRLGRRSGGLRYRVRRWVFHRRTTIALSLAAFIAVTLALFLWSSLSSAVVGVDAIGADAPAPAHAP